MVPLTGLEPVRDCSHGILSPGCLPIPPQRQKRKAVIIHLTTLQVYHDSPSLSRFFLKIFFFCFLELLFPKKRDAVYLAADLKDVFPQQTPFKSVFVFTTIY